MARMHSSTVENHFGSWGAGLDKAQIPENIAPRPKRISREKVIRAVREIVAENPSVCVRQSVVAARLGVHVTSISDARMGKWKELVADADARPIPAACRYSDEECFENILRLWMHYGRQPHYAELRLPPSTVGPKAYCRFGGWRRALKAFVERASSHIPISDDRPCESRLPSKDALSRKRTPREIPLGLRYRVLLRDGNQCKLCGRRPPQIEIHIDHIRPWAAGGETVMENLRVLCSDCNLGKGTTIENL